VNAFVLSTIGTDLGPVDCQSAICSAISPRNLTWGHRLADQDFGEQLPDQCPPDGIGDEALGPVFRLVPTSDPDETCFSSKLALAETPPPGYKGTACEWASCSLNRSVDALLKIRGLVMRNPFVARLEIPAAKGKHDAGKAHINFWKYKGFDLSSAVVETWEHGK